MKFYHIKKQILFIIIQENFLEKQSITLIASRIDINFDVLASMLAAQKIYPCSKIAFHDEGDKILNHFFLKSSKHLFNIIFLNEIKNYHINRLVLVGTRKKTLLGDLQEIIKKNNFPVDIYDYHEKTVSDIKGNIDIHKKAGATATIMADILIKKDIPISPEEATILSLGIYENTDFFTLNSTTGNDFKIAGLLKDMGADTLTISSILSRDMSPEQLTLLNDMVKSSKNYRMNNLNVIVSSVSSNSYLPDTTFLVHKLNKMEASDALFVLIRMDGKIFLKGKSNSEEINIEKIMSVFGGEGHFFSGSAVINGLTLAQMQDRLLFEIRNYLKCNVNAKDLMSSPPIIVDPGDSIETASDILTKYNINALLVVDKNKDIKGIISRQVIEKAKYHNIIHVPVKEYMNSDFMDVSENASISEIQKKIIENRQRILPVKNDKGVLSGVLTRTDLLNHIISDFRESPFITDKKLETINPGVKNIANLLKKRLPGKIYDLLLQIGETADKTGLNVFLVGGCVRDIFLFIKKSEFDIDLVVEGDGIEFSKALSLSLNAKLNSFARFKTAVITLSDDLKIDVATARTEIYSSPAALPEVEMSSLKLDLYRRDFTINTLAVQLNKKKFGLLIDYFFAQKDLKDKVIRIIHNLSFVEDPTRIFRAIRFEKRFGFKTGKFTEKLIKNAIDMEFFKRLSGPRVFTEFKYILMEENPVPALERIEELNLFKAINKKFWFTKINIEIILSSQKVINWFTLNQMTAKIEKWEIFFHGIIHNCTQETAEEICTKFCLPPKKKILFTKEHNDAKLLKKWFKQQKNIKNSEIYEKLYPLKTETILYLMAITKDEAVKNYIVRYFTEIIKIKPKIKGAHLIELGFKRGPLFGEILNSVLLSKIDGNLESLKDEIDFARRYL